MCKTNQTTPAETVNGESIPEMIGSLTCDLSQDAMGAIEKLVSAALPKILKDLFDGAIEMGEDPEMADSNYSSLTVSQIRKCAIDAVTLAMNGYSQIIGDSKWNDLV